MTHSEGNRSRVPADILPTGIGGILSNVANKFLLDGFFSVERTWRNICAVRNVSDFKTVTSYRLIAANAPGSLAIEGVFDFAKATGTSSGIAVGTKVYWDATNKVATATASTNKYLGKTTKTAADGDATVRVRLIP